MQRCEFVGATNVTFVRVEFVLIGRGSRSILEAGSIAESCA